MEERRPASIFALSNHEIYAITAQHADRTNVQLATWIMPASLAADRPRLVAAISPFNLTHELIERSGRFVVNLLAEGQHAWIARFGLVSGRDYDKLRGVACIRTPGGMLALPGTCGWAESVVVHKLEGGDRTIFLADIRAQMVYPDRRPLRLREAAAMLPDEIQAALANKRQHDGERDQDLAARLGQK